MEPSMNFRYGKGKVVRATRENTCLYRFFGQMSIYDHIFVIVDEESGKGIYLFSFHSEFEETSEYLMANDYPAYLNLRSVADCDKKALNDVLGLETRDLEDGVPTDWTK